MRWSDFCKLQESLIHIKQCIQLRHLTDADCELDQAIDFLEKQQCNKPRGKPFNLGEDARRKDRLVKDHQHE